MQRIPYMPSPPMVEISAHRVAARPDDELSETPYNSLASPREIHFDDRFTDERLKECRRAVLDQVVAICDGNFCEHLKGVGQRPSKSMPNAGMDVFMTYEAFTYLRRIIGSDLMLTFSTVSPHDNLVRVAVPHGSFSKLTAELTLSDWTGKGGPSIENQLDSFGLDPELKLLGSDWYASSHAVQGSQSTLTLRPTQKLVSIQFYPGDSLLLYANDVPCIIGAVGSLSENDLLGFAYYENLSWRAGVPSDSNSLEAFRKQSLRYEKLLEPFQPHAQAAHQAKLQKMMARR